MTTRDATSDHMNPGPIFSLQKSPKSRLVALLFRFSICSKKNRIAGWPKCTIGSESFRRVEGCAGEG